MCFEKICLMWAVWWLSIALCVFHIRKGKIFKCFNLSLGWLFLLLRSSYLDHVALGNTKSYETQRNNHQNLYLQLRVASFFFSLRFLNLIWKAKRVLAAEQEIFHFLGHSSNGCNSQTWDRQKQGVKNSIWVSHMSGRGPNLSRHLLPTSMP